ncbi:MAG: substrate-binding domain-containing protein [Bacteroidota bacterium]
MKVRIKDIARLAAVSPGTVDRVIHERGEVSEKTREKVRKIIEELNYQPDILARTLASKKNFLFSVIMPVSANENDFWNSPRAGIDKAINEVSTFGVEVRAFYFDQFDISSFKEKSEKILEEKPDAILFAPVFPKESLFFIEKCKELNIPVMLFNSNLEEARDTMYIGQDALQSGYLGARLLTYGLKDEGDVLIINIAGRKDNHNHILRRERGFRKYFAEHSEVKSRVITIDCVLEQGKNFEEYFKNAIERYRVRALFVTNSRVYRVADFLEKQNIRNISLLGYDLLPQNVEALKKGTIDFLISQKPEQQGYMGIITLFNKLVLQKNIEKSQYIPIDIITRENIDYYEYK